MREIKRTVYPHGGSRIWIEDDKGNRELVADIYGQPYTDLIFEAVKTKSLTLTKRENGTE